MVVRHTQYSVNPPYPSFPCAHPVRQFDSTQHTSFGSSQSRQVSFSLKHRVSLPYISGLQARN